MSLASRIRTALVSTGIPLDGHAMPTRRLTFTLGDTDELIVELAEDVPGRGTLYTRHAITALELLESVDVDNVLGYLIAEEAHAIGQGIRLAERDNVRLDR